MGTAIYRRVEVEITVRVLQTGTPDRHVATFTASEYVDDSTQRINAGTADGLRDSVLDGIGAVTRRITDNVRQLCEHIRRNGGA